MEIQQKDFLKFLLRIYIYFFVGGKEQNSYEMLGQRIKYFNTCQ